MIAVLLACQLALVPEGQVEGPKSAAVTATFTTGSERDPAMFQLAWDRNLDPSVYYAVYLGPTAGQWTERVDVGNAGGLTGVAWANVPIRAPGTYVAVVVAYVEAWGPVPEPPFATPTNLRLRKGD